MLKDFFTEQLVTEAQRRCNPWLGLVQHTGSALNLGQSPAAQWPGGTQTGHSPPQQQWLKLEGAVKVMKASQVPGDYWCVHGASRGLVPAVFGAGLEGEQEGTGLFAQQGVREGACIGTWVVPKWSKEKGPWNLTVPCKATCTLARAECEEQLASSIEANDGSYRVMEQTD